MANEMNVERKENQQRLTSFLEQHGETVEIVRMQDELKRELQGKSMNTVRRVWFVCKFPDNYTIEVEQSHGDPTSQVPMIGDKWKLGIWGREFYFRQKQP